MSALAGDTAGIASGGSMLDRLRQKRRDAAAQETIDIPVAGWGGDIVARYRLLDPLVEGKEIGDNVRKQFKNDPTAQEFWALVDTLIRACEGLYGVDTDGDLKPLSEDGAEAVKYDALADALDVPYASVRDAVIGVFKGNKVAVRAHALRLQMWMADPEGDLRLGEL